MENFACLRHNLPFWELGANRSPISALLEFVRSLDVPSSAPMFGSDRAAYLAQAPVGWFDIVKSSGDTAITLQPNLTMPMSTSTPLRILTLLGSLLVVGCATSHPSAVRTHPASPQVQLANVYRPPVAGVLTRVAVLPLSGDVQPPDALREMDKTFHAEFNKPQVFEGVKVSRPEMAEIIHQEQLPSTEPIPRELLLALQQKYSAEAVLFTDITHYRPYRPISISVRTKLVSLKTNEVLWAIDANFDSAEPGVAQAARNFSKITEQNPGLLKAADSSGVLLSPQRFARFVAREVFATLPDRLPPRE